MSVVSERPRVVKPQDDERRRQIGLNIRRLREARGLRIEDMAARTKFGPELMRQLERGEAAEIANGTLVHRLCVALGGIEPHVLFGESERRLPPGLPPQPTPTPKPTAPAAPPAPSQPSPAATIIANGSPAPNGSPTAAEDRMPMSSNGSTALSKPEPGKGLTLTECHKLDELEAIIDAGHAKFLEVGAALLEIRDRRLYRQDHPTFESYVKHRWGWTRGRAYQICRAFKAAEEERAAGRPVPKSEHKIREALKARNAAKRPAPAPVREDAYRLDRRTFPRDKAARIEELLRQVCDLHASHPEAATLSGTVNLYLDELRRCVAPAIPSMPASRPAPTPATV